MKTSSSNGARPAAYSSEQLTPLQLHEENAHGSSRPASRQVFSVELKSLNEARSGLVIRSSSQRPRLAVLTNNVDRAYRTQGGEQALPMTPRLEARFDAISNARKRLSNSDRNSYESFDADHEDLLNDPRIEFPSAAETRLQSDVSHVPFGGIQVLIVPPGQDLKLGSTGIANCLACGMRVPLGNGYTALAFAHFNGSDPDTGEYLSPRELLDKMIQSVAQRINAPDAAVKAAAEIMVAGGERARGDSDANRLGDEEDFLDLKDSYPIVAARVQATHVDLNSDRDTIARHTDDDEASSINAVISAGRFICSRAPLYEGH